jgi:hypothetical protein
MKIKILNSFGDITTQIINPFEYDSDCYVLKFFFKANGTFFDNHYYLDLWDYTFNGNLGNDVMVKFKI